MVDPSKLANIPLARPGFDALGMTAPVLIQVNPDGKWEKQPPENMDEQKLKCIIQYLVNSKAVSAAQSYCCQCCAESQKSGGASNYVPVIMMPILPADQCPFDPECELKKLEAAKKEDHPKKGGEKRSGTEEKKEPKKKSKKRGYVLQRFSNFDYESQW